MTEPTPEETVAANIRTRRATLNLTQADLSERVTATGHDLGDQSVWALENGRRRIRIDDLYAIAHALNTTPAALLTDGSTVEPDAQPPRAYLVRLDGGITERFTADHVTLDDGWLTCRMHGHEVLSAPTTRIICIRPDPNGSQP